MGNERDHLNFDNEFRQKFIPIIQKSRQVKNGLMPTMNECLALYSWFIDQNYKPKTHAMTETNEKDLIRMSDNLRWILDKLLTAVDDSNSIETREKEMIELMDSIDLKHTIECSLNIFRDISNRKTDINFSRPNQ